MGPPAPPRLPKDMLSSIVLAKCDVGSPALPKAAVESLTLPKNVLGSMAAFKAVADSAALKAVADSIALRKDLLERAALPKNALGSMAAFKAVANSAALKAVADSIAVRKDVLERVALAVNVLDSMTIAKKTVLERMTLPAEATVSAPPPAATARGRSDAALRWEQQLPLAEPRRMARPDVPRLGEQLLSFLVAPERLEERLGDMEQGFRVMLERHGPGHAKRWYWAQVVGIAAAGAARLVVRVAKIWGAPG